MIWNPWKRIKELEYDLAIQKMASDRIENGIQQSLQTKDNRITELEGDLALLLDGHIEALNAKVKARLGVDEAKLNAQLAMAHNLRNRYMPLVGGIGNLITGNIFS
jgi:uncharacterized coiled-coil protein SlyX